MRIRYIFQSTTLLIIDGNVYCCTQFRLMGVSSVRYQHIMALLLKDPQWLEKQSRAGDVRSAERKAEWGVMYYWRSSEAIGVGHVGWR